MNDGPRTARRSPARGFVATAVLAAAVMTWARVAASCVDLDSLGNGRPDAAPDTVVVVPDSSADAPDPCAHEVPPPAPAIDDSPGEELPAFEVALDQVTLAVARARGYDLDGLCTCDPRPGTAGDGGPSCASRVVTCDLEGGVDNSLGAVAQAAAPITDLDIVPNRIISTGSRSLVVQLAKYNGRANDKEVVVGAFPAEGIRAQGCPSSVFDNTKGVWSPGRCGNDPWTLSPSGVVSTGGGILLPVVVGTGYVRDFKLVVRFRGPASVPVTETRGVAFASPLMTADLVPLGEDLAPRDRSRPPTANERRLYRLENGILAGRLASGELLYAIGSFPSQGTKLCATAAFDFVRTRICESSDVQRDPASTPDPAKPCDALSASFGFTALPARATTLFDGSVPSDECATLDAGGFTCP